MPTLFAIPKPFRGHIAVIQENAIHSWTTLGPDYNVVLFGREEGTDRIAQKLGVRHIPDVARNKYETPLLNDLFKQAEAQSDDPYLCYINADIILMSDFAQAVSRITRRKRRFLMVGQRLDFDQTEPIAFEQDWESKLREQTARHGQLKNPTGIDYFFFRRGLWGTIPPFAVGRTAFDNWLIYRARALKIPVVDATEAVTAIHQNHDYSHAGTGYNWIWRGPEAKLNQALAGHSSKMFTIWDSTHVLTPNALNRRQHNTGLGGGIWSYRRSVRMGA